MRAACTVHTVIFTYFCHVFGFATHLGKPTLLSGHWKITFLTYQNCNNGQFCLERNHFGVGYPVLEVIVEHISSQKVQLSL